MSSAGLSRNTHNGTHCQCDKPAAREHQDERRTDPCLKSATSHFGRTPSSMPPTAACSAGWRGWRDPPGGRAGTHRPLRHPRRLPDGRGAHHPGLRPPARHVIPPSARSGAVAVMAKAELLAACYRNSLEARRRARRTDDRVPRDQLRYYGYPAKKRCPDRGGHRAGAAEQDSLRKSCWWPDQRMASLLAEICGAVTEPDAPGAVGPPLAGSRPSQGRSPAVPETHALHAVTTAADRQFGGSPSSM